MDTGRVRNLALSKDQQSRWLAKQLLMGASLLLFGFFVGAGQKFVHEPEEDCSHGLVSFASRGTEPEHLETFDINVVVEDAEEVIKEQGWRDLASGLSTYVPTKLAAAGLQAKIQAAKGDSDEGLATLTFTLNGQEEELAAFKFNDGTQKEAASELFRSLTHLGLAQQAVEMKAKIQHELRQGYAVAKLKESMAADRVEAEVMPVMTAALEARETATQAMAELEIGTLLLHTKAVSFAKDKVFAEMPSILKDLLGVPANFIIDETLDVEDGSSLISVIIKEFDYMKMLSIKKGQAFSDNYASVLQSLKRLEGMGLPPTGAALRKIRAALDAQCLPGLAVGVADALQKQAGLVVQAKLREPFRRIAS
jgi:hypothetical protein